MRKITFLITLFICAVGFSQVKNVSSLGENNPVFYDNYGNQNREILAPCSESNAGNAFEDGLSYAGIYSSGNDITVNADEDFTLNQIVYNSFHAVGETVTSVDVTYYEDNAGLPGAIIGSEAGVVPTSQMVVGSNFGLDVSEVTLDVAPFMFAGQAGMPTTYWIIFSNGTSSGGGGLFWEISSASAVGNPMAIDNGNGWGIYAPTLDGVYSFNGDCTPIVGGGSCTNTTYTSATVPFDIDGAGSQTTDCTNAPNLIPVTVTGNGTIGTDADLDNVTIDISHTWSSDLDIYLISPSGTELELATDNGGSSDDAYNGTMFQDGGADITAAAPPFGVGPYAPEGGTFAATFAGESITGDWNLKVCDDVVGDTGTVNSFEITFCITPVDNDLCDNAIAVACGDVMTGDTSDNTDTGGNLAPDEWYSFTGSGTAESVTFSLCGSSYDTLIRVFDACGGNEIATNDDSCGLQSEVSFLSDGVSTYYVMIEGFGSDAGAYTLEVTCVQPPVNDECTGALPITCGETVMGTTINATIDDAVAPTCDTGVTSPGVWYTFTDASGLVSDVTISMCSGAGGADYDTKLSVYTGDCGAPPLTCVVGNDDTCGLQSEVTFQSDGVSTYYVLVHGFGGATGNFTLDVTCTPIPPVNDLIANSIDLDAIGACPDYTDPAVPFPAATFEGGNPVDCNINGVNGVWYNITVDGDGFLFADIATPAGISVVNFYEAPNETAVESDLTLVHYVDNQCAPHTSASIPVVNGTTYYLFVANTGGISDVNITCDILGVNENTIEGFSFYPNPTNGELNVTAQNTIENIAIFNVLGQKVLDVNVDATTSQINVSNLTTGAYFMKVTVDGVVGTYKILKQ